MTENQAYYGQDPFFDVPKSEKQIRAEVFLNNEFWIKDFLPMLKLTADGFRKGLEFCDLKQVKQYRAKLEVITKLIEYPHAVIEYETQNEEMEALKEPNAER